MHIHFYVRCPVALSYLLLPPRFNTSTGCMYTRWSLPSSPSLPTLIVTASDKIHPDSSLDAMQHTAAHYNTLQHPSLNAITPEGFTERDQGYPDSSLDMIASDSLQPPPPTRPLSISQLHHRASSPPLTTVCEGTLLEATGEVKERGKGGEEEEWWGLL